MSKDTQKPGAIPQFILRVAPFLLPALFFQSAIFAFISPLPLFILTLKNRLWVSIFALATNAIFLFTTSSRTELYVACFLWVSIGICFPSLIRLKIKVQKSFTICFILSVCFILATFYALSHEANLNITEYLKTQISLGVDHLAALPDSPVKKLIEEQGRTALMHQLMTELPSGVLISLILIFWINLLFASQLIRGFLSKSFWANFKNPEWMIWPTIICAATFAFTEHAPYYLGLNGFKVFLVFYGLQGLSVITFLLNRYKVHGFGRAILFSLAVFLAMPLVLSLGFFDLWFDFRHKFVQS